MSEALRVLPWGLLSVKLSPCSLVLALASASGAPSAGGVAQADRAHKSLAPVPLAPSLWVPVWSLLLSLPLHQQLSQARQELVGGQRRPGYLVPVLLFRCCRCCCRYELVASAATVV